jgi:hypothetical protein
MTILAWLGGICGAVVLAVALLLIYFWWEEEHVRKKGRVLFAALVQANNMLFEPGDDDLPAQFLITFDPKLQQRPRELLTMAERVFDLKNTEPKGPDLQLVARTVTDEKYRPDSRDKLPVSFTGGPVVYSVHIMVHRALLKNGILQKKYIVCKALPGDSGPTLMVPYSELPQGKVSS